MAECDLVAYFRGKQPEMMEVLGDLVGQESPSTHKPSLDELARYLAGRFRGAGASVRIVPGGTHGDHVLAKFPGGGGQAGNGAEPARPALAIGHFDTVWPLGTLASRPFRVEDGRAWGPGVLDMKSGVVIAEFAMRAIAEEGLELPRPVTFILNSDEEVGSLSSRALIEEQARRSAYALILEPALMPTGLLKTARKGVGRFRLRVEGRAAHAGTEPERGISATQELAHQVLRLHALNDREAQTTVNVGVVRGGIRPNVVAAEAEAEIDVRVWTQAEADRVGDAILGATAVTPGARVKASGKFTRPPMERSAGIAALFGRACEIGRGLGMELMEGSTGGGSDGNFCAALGVPTLDGLGPLGDGAHADHEQVYVDTMAQRAALLTALLLQL